MNRRTESDWSTYLDDDDRHVLQTHLEEENSVSLATGFAEAWITLPNNQKSWHKVDTGILCFVKDYNFKAYYFRLFSLDFCVETVKPELLWEQELSLPFNYNKVTSRFHFFGTDFGYASFNFMFEDEAAKVLKIVQNKNNDKKYKKLKNQQAIQAEKQLWEHSPVQIVANSTALISPTTVNSSTPLRRMKSVLSRTLSNSSVVNFIKTKMTKQERKAIDKSQIGEPTEPRLVKHGGMNDDYEKRFRDILVELNMSFKEKSMSESSDRPADVSQADETFEELSRSATKAPGVKRFAPPPPPRAADPNELAAYLGKKATQAPFPPTLTPPISPNLPADAKRDAETETLRHCTLTPIEKVTLDASHFMLTPSDAQESPSGQEQQITPGHDFNDLIGFKGFTNKVYMTPKLKAAYEPSFLSATYESASDPAAFPLDKLRAELLRQAPYLSCQSDGEEP